MITLSAVARCPVCGVLAEGTMADVDRAAEKHNRAARHPTTTVATPAPSTSAGSPPAAPPPEE